METSPFPGIRAVALDFDGVILDSVPVKTNAFRELFAHAGPERCARIVAYHEANGGLSRFVKFRWACTEVLGRPYTEADERELGRRFNELVEAAVLKAPFIPGAAEFLERFGGKLPLFVVSGTPQEEVRRIAARRGLSRWLRAVYGSPEKKADILRAVVRELGCAPEAVVMVGDAQNDLDGASQAGVRFIGVGGGSFPAGTLVLADLRALADALRDPG
ncbi:MAG: hypothetical protein A2X36_00195 [Elusimicrobia bacterium GWA2_69_24]|nr:MAG: hypothetical protein A2X36_00195 [Elusimicrobia bacterium GWA2_69_24]HBL17806.1 HAD family hydrolase [Elusimicrobiota bacterium]